jgi:hypothetical protein
LNKSAPTEIRSPEYEPVFRKLQRNTLKDHRASRTANMFHRTKMLVVTEWGDYGIRFSSVNATAMVVGHVPTAPEQVICPLQSRLRDRGIVDQVSRCLVP